MDSAGTSSRLPGKRSRRPPTGTCKLPFRCAHRSSTPRASQFVQPRRLKPGTIHPAAHKSSIAIQSRSATFLALTRSKNHRPLLFSPYGALQEPSAKKAFAASSIAVLSIPDIESYTLAKEISRYPQRPAVRPPSKGKPPRVQSNRNSWCSSFSHGGCTEYSLPLEQRASRPLPFCPSTCGPVLDLQWRIKANPTTPVRRMESVIYLAMLMKRL